MTEVTLSHKSKASLVATGQYVSSQYFASLLLLEDGSAIWGTTDLKSVLLHSLYNEPISPHKTAIVWCRTTHTWMLVGSEAIGNNDYSVTIIDHEVPAPSRSLAPRPPLRQWTPNGPIVGVTDTLQTLNQLQTPNTTPSPHSPSVLYVAGLTLSSDVYSGIYTRYTKKLHLNTNLSPIVEECSYHNVYTHPNYTSEDPVYIVIIYNVVTKHWNLIQLTTPLDDVECAVETVLAESPAQYDTSSYIYSQPSGGTEQYVGEYRTSLKHEYLNSNDLVVRGGSQVSLVHTNQPTWKILWSDSDLAWKLVVQRSDNTVTVILPQVSVRLLSERSSSPSHDYANWDDTIYVSPLVYNPDLPDYWLTHVPETSANGHYVAAETTMSYNTETGAYTTSLKPVFLHDNDASVERYCIFWDSYNESWCLGFGDYLGQDSIRTLGWHNGTELLPTVGENMWDDELSTIITYDHEPVYIEPYIVISNISGTLNGTYHFLGRRGWINTEDSPGEAVFDDQYSYPIYEREENDLSQQAFAMFDVSLNRWVVTKVPILDEETIHNYALSTGIKAVEETDSGYDFPENGATWCRIFNDGALLGASIHKSLDVYRYMEPTVDQGSLYPRLYVAGDLNTYWNGIYYPNQYLELDTSPTADTLFVSKNKTCYVRSDYATSHAAIIYDRAEGTWKFLKIYPDNSTPSCDVTNGLLYNGGTTAMRIPLDSNYITIANPEIVDVMVSITEPPSIASVYVETTLDNLSGIYERQEGYMDMESATGKLIEGSHSIYCQHGFDGETVTGIIVYDITTARWVLGTVAALVADTSVEIALYSNQQETNRLPLGTLVDEDFNLTESVIYAEEPAPTTLIVTNATFADSNGDYNLSPLTHAFNSETGSLVPNNGTRLYVKSGPPSGFGTAVIIYDVTTTKWMITLAVGMPDSWNSYSGVHTLWSQQNELTGVPLGTVWNDYEGNPVVANTAKG